MKVTGITATLQNLDDGVYTVKIKVKHKFYFTTHLRYFPETQQKWLHRFLEEAQQYCDNQGIEFIYKDESQKKSIKTKMRLIWGVLKGV